MKNNTAPDVDVFARPENYCDLASFRLLVENARILRLNGVNVRQTHAPGDDSGEETIAAPSAREAFCAELEASQFAPHRNASGEAVIRHDCPQELARARRVFALTLLIPILLLSMLLLIFGPTLDKPLFSLLQFSVLALAVPLSACAGGWLLRMLKHRRH